MFELPSNNKTLNRYLEPAQDDYAWLGLSHIPETVNPLFPDYGFHEPPDTSEEILRVMMNPDYLHFTCKHLFNFELLPFQAAALDALWNHRLPIMVCTRGFSKSTLLAVYTLLRLIFHPGCKVAVVGAAFRQSREIWENCQRIWYNSPILQDVCDSKREGPRREIDRCEFRIGKSMAYFLPMGDGCVSPSTLSTYKNGIYRISDTFPSHDTNIDRQVFNSPSYIWSNNGFKLSDYKFYNGIKPTKKITTKKGFEFEATHNHEIQVMSASGVVWKRMDELNIGDRPLIDKAVRWHNGNTDVTPAEAYAIGLLVGDGSFTKPSTLSFATKDEELIDGLNNGTPYKWKVCSDGVHWSGTGGDEKKLQYLSQWGFDNKTKTQDKCFPQIILNSSKNVMSSFIRGLFDTDGGVQVSDAKGGKSIIVSFYNTSHQLVKELQYILTHYGIVANISHRDRKNWARSYHLIITGPDVKTFAKEIGFGLKRKQEILQGGVENKLRWRYSNDEIPFVKDNMHRIAQQYSKVYTISGSSQERNLYNKTHPGTLDNAKSITRVTAERFLDRYGDCGDPFIDILRQVSDVDIYFDEVVGISDSECATYDMNVPVGHQYCANGFYSHNSTIRGIRANYIIADEFASINEDVFAMVVQGFGAVSARPDVKVKRAATRARLKRDGLWEEHYEEYLDEDNTGNQIIYSGTASFAFNHFARYFETWSKIIKSKGDKKKLVNILGQDPDTIPGFDWRQYAIIRIPYDQLPTGFLDEGIVAQAKATLHTGHFYSEYCAIFIKDTNGFFKRSIIEAATTNRPITTKAGEKVKFSVQKYGNPDCIYVIGVDPAADVDNAAIVVLELHKDHRRIVSCWTTNTKKFKEYKKYAKRTGMRVENNYYYYIASKIRELVSQFKTEAIVIDKHGGGKSIVEALGSPHGDNDTVPPIYEIIDPDDPKPEDGEEGLHILNVLAPDTELNSDANHGMLKDLEEKELLFPAFDSIELEKFVQIDAMNNTPNDTYEDIVDEIEELKNEMTTIVVTQTSKLGKEHFDVPTIKEQSQVKGKLRKDRYSALLYANWYARNMDKDAAYRIEYKAVGGVKESFKYKSDQGQSGSMYYGPGTVRFKNHPWMTGIKPTAIRRK